MRKSTRKEYENRIHELEIKLMETEYKLQDAEHMIDEASKYEKPEGCKIGMWCTGCKYAENIEGYWDPLLHIGTKVIRICKYGACKHREV